MELSVCVCVAHTLEMERNDTVIADFSLSLLPVLVGQEVRVWATEMCVCVCALGMCVSHCLVITLASDLPHEHPGVRPLVSPERGGGSGGGECYAGG